MKKIEIIWRELLFQVIEKNNRKFTQRDLADYFGFSTSTVFQALKPARQMGAARVGGRNFVLEDPEKLLYHWASVRNLSTDIIFQGRVDMTVSEIEGLIPPGAAYAAYSAAKKFVKEPPADYSKVYFYADNLEEIKKRYRLVGRGEPNLFVLQPDRFLTNYGQTTTLAQTFVDLWNLQDWYAKEFTEALKDKIDELLP